MTVEIKDGLVVAKGSGREFEFTVPHKPERSLLAGESSSVEPSSNLSGARSGGSISRRNLPLSPTSSSPRDEMQERRENMREIADVLANLGRRNESGSKGEKAEEILNALRSMEKGRPKVDSGAERTSSGKISGENNYRVSDSESEKLNNLGKELDNSESAQDRLERIRRLREHNLERAEKMRQRIREMREKKR